MRVILSEYVVISTVKKQTILILGLLQVVRTVIEPNILVLWHRG